MPSGKWRPFYLGLNELKSYPDPLANNELMRITHTASLAQWVMHVWAVDLGQAWFIYMCAGELGDPD